VLTLIAMKGLTVIVLAFAIFAYDISYNNGEIVYEIALALGLR
jgi:hypothetical protein